MSSTATSATKVSGHRSLHKSEAGDTGKNIRPEFIHGND